MPKRARKNTGSWLDGFGALGEPIRAIKLGPSIVAVLATLGAFGLVAIGGVVYLLSSQPIYAIAAAALVAIFIWSIIRLLLKFTESNPVVAALGGGQLLQFLEGQMGAKNSDIVIDHQPSVSGTPQPVSLDGSQHE